MQSVAAALNTALVGGRLRKVWSGTRGGLLLKLHREGADHLLLVNAASGHCGAGLIVERPAAPPRPPAAVAYLRSRCDGGRLIGVRCWPGILMMTFSGAPGETSLLLDRTGKIPGLLLLDDGKNIKVADRWDPAGGVVRPNARWPEPEAGEFELLPVDEPLRLLREEGSRLLVGLGGGSDGDARGGKEKEAGRWRKKLQRRIVNIENDLATLPDPEKLGDRAKWLMANHWKLAADSGAVPSAWPEVPETEQDLLPARGRTLGEKIQNLYGRAKKVQRAILIGQKRLAEAREALDGPGPPPIAAEKTAAGKSGEKKPFRRYLSSDGWRILVGRNRVENDRLLKEARPWDLWLHARGGSGAHVLVVKPGREAKVPERTLAEAAGLAAAHSSLSAEKVVDVMHIEAARVKKPKGAGPGQVLVSGEKNILIAPGAGTPKII